MALIHDIQHALLDENSSVGGILLKLRFLAAKLEANILEEWVQHEVEGYPEDVYIPDYRVAQITYSGTFADSVRQLNNVSIPIALIAQHAGDHWVRMKIRDGLPLIESQLRNMKPDTHFGIDCSNLKILLHNKVYPGMSIVDITSRIDEGAFDRIRHAVRAKTLDFTLQLENRVPAATAIEVGAHPIEMSSDDQKHVKYLTQHIFYGDVTNINSGGGANSRINLNSTDHSANTAE